MLGIRWLCMHWWLNLTWSTGLLISRKNVQTKLVPYTYDNREFSIVRERRHVTPCLSSAPSSTGYCELGGISSSVLSVFFTDKFYKLLKSLHLIGWEQICQWKTLRQNAWWNAPPPPPPSVDNVKSVGLEFKICDVMFKLRPFVHWLLAAPPVCGQRETGRFWV